MVRNRARMNLRTAANIIHRRGFIKGHFGGETVEDPVCLLRAIELAKADADIWHIGEECIAFADFLELPRGDGVFGGRSVGSRDRESRSMGALLLWSEHPDRTQAQVCNALLRASA